MSIEPKTDKPLVLDSSFNNFHIMGLADPTARPVGFSLFPPWVGLIHSQKGRTRLFWKYRKDREPFPVFRW